jgi:hypothetical protein
MQVRRLTTLAAVTLPLMFVSGCGGDPVKPKPFETPTASTSPTPTQTAPPQAESAEAFVRRWVTAQNDMQMSGDTKDYRSMGFKCDACDGFADIIDRIYAAGGHVETLGWRIVSIQDGPTKLSFALDVDIRPTTYVEVKGGPKKRLPGGSPTEFIQFLKRAGQWRVTRVTETRS